MKTTILIILFCLTVNINLKSQNYTQKPHDIKTKAYKMSIDIDFKENKMDVLCELSFKNSGNNQLKSIPILLYRLLKVKSIKDLNGNELKFSQQVTSFEDDELLQVNFINAFLNSPIQKNKQETIIIEYCGYLKGYTETGSSYLHDNISSDFTIIREDCYAYPIVGYPNDKINRLSGFQSYDYLIEVTVPDSLAVANGGKLIQKTESNNYVTYIYKNIKPAWRMDIAITDYGIAEWKNLKIFYFKEDSLGAENVMNTAKKSFELYSEWWGELHDFKGFTIIEIPDNWGSQTDVSCIIQTASSFKDTSNIIEFYHELSHFWNVRSNDRLYSRWNEGLAMFLQYLTEEKLSTNKRLKLASDWSLQKIKSDLRFETYPLIQFGEEGLTDLSYRMGIAMFNVLYDLMGENDFNALIKTFYQRYHNTGATTEVFIQTAMQISDDNLDDFFNDWMYTTKYAALVKKGYTIKDFVKLYK